MLIASDEVQIGLDQGSVLPIRFLSTVLGILSRSTVRYEFRYCGGTLSC